MKVELLIHGAGIVGLFDLPWEPRLGDRLADPRNEEAEGRLVVKMSGREPGEDLVRVRAVYVPTDEEDFADTCD